MTGYFDDPMVHMAEVDTGWAGGPNLLFQRARKLAFWTDTAALEAPASLHWAIDAQHKYCPVGGLALPNQNSQLLRPSVHSRKQHSRGREIMSGRLKATTGWAI